MSEGHESRGGEQRPDADELAGVATRLREIAEALRSPELPDEEAAELSREAAELSASAGRRLAEQAAELGRPGVGPV